jgi:ABC-type branched-subunit amino acid transport system ATPase component
MNPDLLCCDEVFSGLSMAEIASMVPLLERLRRNGITIIMVEHRLRELFKIANRLIVMNFGEKIADGIPHEVMKKDEVRKAYLGEESAL